MAVVVARHQRERPSESLPVPLAPLTGGMNNVGARQAIAENEAVDLTNLEVDLDGSLATRPPVERSDTTYANVQHELLGTAQSVAGATLLVIAFPTAGKTRIYELGAGLWYEVAPFAATGFAQYDNKLVMCQAGGSGGYYDLAGAGYTATTQMPAMDGIVYYLGRFYGFGRRGAAAQTTLYWSKLSVPSVSSVYDWATSTDYITVGAGDGQPITGLFTDTSGLVVLKTSSTYRFSYPPGSGPASGTLMALSSTIGTDNRLSYVAVENVYMTFCNGNVYQFQQSKYAPVSRGRIRFQGTTVAGISQAYSVVVSLFADRLMVWFYGTLYVYSITTNTWSRWVCTDAYPAIFVTVPASYTKAGARIAYAVTGLLDGARHRLYRVTTDRAGVAETGGFTWSVTTRAYDFGSAMEYKRLMWWAASVRSARVVRPIVFPLVVPKSAVSWDALALSTWDVLAQSNWDTPLFVQSQVEDDVAYPTAVPLDMKIRMRAAMVFLGAYFQLSGDVDGTTTTSPARVYTITPYLRIRTQFSGRVG